MGPSWGADGKTVAASKIYANFPHMRASEIRWFDLSGGNGRVLVEPPKNGRDIQESRFSPDGGLESFIRLPYTLPPDALRDGVRRLAASYASLTTGSPVRRTAAMIA